MTLQKDQSVTHALDLLRAKFGDALVVEDHWDADLMAIGLTSHGNPGLLVYFCTFNREPGRYYVDLEFPAPPGSDRRSVQGEAFEDVDFDTLAAIVSRHLNLVSVVTCRCRVITGQSAPLTPPPQPDRESLD